VPVPVVLIVYVATSSSLISIAQVVDVGAPPVTTPPAVADRMVVPISSSAPCTVVAPSPLSVFVYGKSLAAGGGAPVVPDAAELCVPQEMLPPRLE